MDCHGVISRLHVIGSMALLSPCLLLGSVQAASSQVEKRVGYELAQAESEAMGDRPDLFERDRDTLEAETQELEAAFPPVDDDADQPQWRPFIFRDANFSIWLPIAGTMSNEVRSLGTDIGTIDFNLISNYLAPTNYIVAYSENLNAEQTESPSLIFDAVRDEILTDSGFTIDHETSATSDRIPGATIPVRELELVNGEELIYLRMGMVGNRIYILGVTQTIGDDGVIDRSVIEELYFKSFRYSPYY